MLMGFGLLSVVLGAFFLWRQRDVKRLFAYSSIEHMGIIAFAFGMGGPVANFAALLAHDGAFIDEIVNFLCRGARGAESRLAAHG
jgi:hydrogenase-4 component F